MELAVLFWVFSFGFGGGGGIVLLLLGVFVLVAIFFKVAFVMLIGSIVSCCF